MAPLPLDILEQKENNIDEAMGRVMGGKRDSVQPKCYAMHTESVPFELLWELDGHNSLRTGYEQTIWPGRNSLRTGN